MFLCSVIITTNCVWMFANMPTNSLPPASLTPPSRHNSPYPLPNVQRYNIIGFVAHYTVNDAPDHSHRCDN